MKPNLTVVAILGAIGVALGALGAHALKPLLASTQLESFNTAVRYHLLHSLFLAIVYAINISHPNKYLKLAFNFSFWGILIFSGSIYLLSLRFLMELEFLRFLGPITPIGGILLILGWISLAFSTKKN